MTDPVARFEHSHAALTRLVMEIREAIREEPGEKSRKHLVERLERLRDELLRHFADEEEGLFPFLRSHVPARAEAVDRLADTHDALCGAVVRLVHLVQDDRKAPEPPTIESHYERFESTYGQHSRAEAALLEELGATLDAPQRTELARILKGL